jgi:hypothetical protein
MAQLVLPYLTTREKDLKVMAGIIFKLMDMMENRFLRQLKKHKKQKNLQQFLVRL